MPLAPMLTYFTLKTWATTFSISVSYGIIGASAGMMTMVPTTLIPLSWFPDHKGKVIGIVASGFGFSSFVFSPIQTLIINPLNLPPALDNSSNNSNSSYFTSKDVLDNVPTALLYLSAVYTSLLFLGFILTVEKIEDGASNMKQDLCSRLRDSFSYLFSKTFTRLDFYLLLLTRFLFLAVGCGVLAHWKTFSFTQSKDDKLISIGGGVSGVVNCLGRIVAGSLMDRFRFNRLMPSIAFLLTVVLISVPFIGEVSFGGLLVCIWIIYALSFTHFTTVPAQTINNFKSPLNSVVVGTVGLADTFSYAFLWVVNSLIMSRDKDPNMFLWLFISLGFCSFLAIFVTFHVSCDPPSSCETMANAENVN